MKRVFTVLGFSLALTLIVLNFINIKYILTVTIGLAAVLAASLFLDKYRKSFVFPLALSACLAACLLMLFQIYTVVQPQLKMDGKSAEVMLYATENPVSMSDGSRSFQAKTVSVDLENAPQNINTYVLCDSDMEIKPYQIVRAKVEFYKISDTAFSSKGYWADKIFLNCRTKSVKVTNAEVNNLLRKIFNIRSSIENRFLSRMSGDSAALSIALVTGNKSYMSYDTKQAFTKSGASHIMAVSGLHLSFAAGMILLILRLFRAGNRIQGLAGISVSLLYMAVAGFSGSITRAGIMMIVMSLGMIIGKRSDALNSLGIAVFLMCLNPFAVCDVGALLSVVAVLSLITVYPMIHMKYDYSDPLEITVKERCQALFVKWMSGFYVSIVVSLCTLPVTYIFFGYVSVVSPITNLIVVPVGSLSMLTSAVGMTHISDFLNSVIISTVKYLSNLSGSVVGISSVSHFGFVLAGVFLIFALYFIMNNRKLLKCAFAVSLALVIAVSAMDCFYTKDKAILYFAENGAYVIHYDDITVVGEVDDYQDYLQAGNFIKSNHFDIDYLVIGQNGSHYSVLLADSVKVHTMIAYELDDTILSSKSYRSLEEYNKFDLTLAEDFKMYYNFGVIEYNIHSMKFTVGKNTGDIVLTNNKVYDRNGAVTLSDGEVLYLIEDKHTFSSRRINLWQE